MANLLANLSKETGLRPADILRIIGRAPISYKTYTIPKRDGSLREISQPAREVKYLQRAFVKIFLSKLPVHDAATAYRQGMSIKDNAIPHAKNGPILKIDLENFFPSIKALDWARYCRQKNVDLDNEEIWLSSRLLFQQRKGARNLTLAIGAPSSPSLSNIIMYDFDSLIIENLENDRVIYTRYADDMTFSAPRTGYLNGVMKTVSTTIRRIPYPNISINSSKTAYITKKYGRKVTGLTLSNDGRVTIGHENKRKISSAVHHVKCGTVSIKDIQILSGMLAYVKSVEPEFIEWLINKYDRGTIERIQRSVVVGQKLPPHPPALGLSNTSLTKSRSEGEAS